MESTVTEFNSRLVEDEKILPYVMKVEEIRCNLCDKNNEFFCCRRCSVSYNPQILEQLVCDNSSSLKVFPGVISGTLKQKVEQLRKTVSNLKDFQYRYQEHSEAIQRKEKLNSEIFQTRSRLQVLEKLHQIRQNKLSLLHRDENILRKSIEQIRKQTRRVLERRSKITARIETKQNSIEKITTSLGNQASALKEIRLEQVSDLATDIFPLVGIQQREDHDKGDLEGTTRHRALSAVEEELAEARRLSYVHGRWIYDQSESPDLVRISIVSSNTAAPVDGKYTVCENWLKSLLKAPANSESHVDEFVLPEIYKSEGASIHAALCYSTHFMHVLKKILDLHLPYKVTTRSFTDTSISVQEFLWNVHKLNGNILAFCLHYGVDPQLIHPLHTLSNLQNGIQTCLHNGGRVSMIRLSPELVNSLEDAMNESSDPLPDEDDDKLEGALLEWEESLHDEDWESLLPTEQEKQTQYLSAASFQSQVHDEMEQSQGLVSSAISWISRGWWNS